MTLIGSNGAGKSTTLRSISGLTPPRTGTIRFDGSDITGHAAAGDRPARHLAVARGPPLLPAHDGAREPRARRLPAPRPGRASASDLERVFELFPRLQEREKQKAGTMSGGEQQMLAIGRALMARPKLLLLDEPSMGLAPILVERIFETVAEINSRARRSCWSSRTRTSRSTYSTRGYVLETGTIALADKSADAAREPRRAEGVPGHMTVTRAASAPPRCTCSSPGWPRRSRPPGSRTARATARSRGWRAGCCWPSSAS